MVSMVVMSIIMMLSVIMLVDVVVMLIVMVLVRVMDLSLVLMVCMKMIMADLIVCRVMGGFSGIVVPYMMIAMLRMEVLVVRVVIRVMSIDHVILRLVEMVLIMLLMMVRSMIGVQQTVVHVMDLGSFPFSEFLTQI